MTYAVIAIDGPAGSGKSTVSRRVADTLGFTLLDTGAIYRTLALVARRAGVDWDDEAGLARLASALDISFARAGDRNRVLLGDEDISDAVRAPEISSGASQVSRHGEVRAALLQLQRGFAERGPVVAEGRDIATVVFPAAALKVYLDARAEVRARRRYDELAAKGEDVTYDGVLAAARARDAADSGREVAPLRAADDATTIDTTALDLDAVVSLVCAAFEATRGVT